MASVLLQIEGKITMTNGTVQSTPVTAYFSYFEHDPLCVNVTFGWEHRGVSVEVDWEFGRDLLVEAFKDGSAGGGDVVIVDSGEWMSFCFFSPEGTAVILLEGEGVSSFLEAAKELVPVGEEDLSEALDEELAEILG